MPVVAGDVVLQVRMEAVVLNRRELFQLAGAIASGGALARVLPKRALARTAVARVEAPTAAPSRAGVESRGRAVRLGEPIQLDVEAFADFVEVPSDGPLVVRYAARYRYQLRADFEGLPPRELHGGLFRRALYEVEAGGKTFAFEGQLSSWSLRTPVGEAASFSAFVDLVGESLPTADDGTVLVAARPKWKALMKPDGRGAFNGGHLLWS